MSCRRLVVFACGLAAAPATTYATSDAESTGRAAETALGARVHVVVAGETLWTIARVYGCTPDELRRRNQLDGDAIYAGLELRVPRCASDSKTQARVRAAKPNSRNVPGAVATHTVEPGDSLDRIAERYGCSVEDLRIPNGLLHDTIYPGDVLVVAPGASARGRAIPGQSVGKAQAGRLIRGTRLASGRGYYVRRPTRAWGANQTVFNVKRAIAAVRARHERLHRLAIGDLSARRGGKITEHRSHQSGRDADIGFYYRRVPAGYPEAFVPATPDNLDFPATLDLLVAFAATASAEGGVERIFLGYDTQRLIYEWAERTHALSEGELGALFQYPNGPYAASGLVRHEPGHDDHIHVRFKCATNDRRCK
jgi:LysM repeat protein